MLFKKFILSLLSALIILFSVAPGFSVYAQTSPPPNAWWNQDFKTWINKVDDATSPTDIFGERYTAAQVQWVIYGLFAFILHSTINTNVLSCILNNAADLSQCQAALESLKFTSILQEPTLAKKESLLGAIFNTDRPISGIGYIKSKLAKFSLVSVAYAQTAGYGFDMLLTVQPMWKAFRDVSYSIFVLAAIVFAFMIMFRVKLSPQTVITVQSAIPKIIIALVLVTFSYAIAGLLIDLMYIVIGFISLIASGMFNASFTNLPGSQSKEFFHFLTTGQPFGGVNIGAIFLLISYSFWLILGLFVNFFASTGIVGWVIGTLTGYTEIVVLILILILIIVIIMSIITSIRVIWTLIKAFANVVLLTIFAPLQIAFGILIPNFGFGQWVRSYVSALSTFVVTGVLILFAYIFCLYSFYLSFTAITGGGIFNFFMQGLFGNTGGSISNVVSGALGGGPNTADWPPLLGSAGAMSGTLFLGISFVIFTMIPKANELVQSFLSGKPFAYGSAIGEAFAPYSAAWGLTGAPVVSSYKQSFGRLGQIATQDKITGWIERHPSVESRLPRTWKRVFNAPPGEE